jgi:hypothetical protein
MKGPSPTAKELKEALQRDGHLYIDALFRQCMKGDAAALKIALEHILGKPPAALKVETSPLVLEVKDARQRLAERIEKLLAAPAVPLKG